MARGEKVWERVPLIAGRVDYSVDGADELVVRGSFEEVSAADVSPTSRQLSRSFTYTFTVRALGTGGAETHSPFLFSISKAGA